MWSGILADPGRHRLGVHGEALGLGDWDARGRQRGGRPADADLGHPAAEVRDGEAGGEARRAVGRERVVRTRHVVAERRAALGADEQAARARDARGERLRRLPHELQVLGRQRLREGQGGVEPGGVDEHLRPAGHGRAGGEQRLDLAADGVEQRAVVGDGGDERVRAVLGLGQQVEGDEARVGPR
jgi:hypothetical protein